VDAGGRIHDEDEAHGAQLQRLPGGGNQTPRKPRGEAQGKNGEAGKGGKQVPKSVAQPHWFEALQHGGSKPQRAAHALATHVAPPAPVPVVGDAPASLLGRVLPLESPASVPLSAAVAVAVVLEMLASKTDGVSLGRVTEASTTAPVAAEPRLPASGANTATPASRAAATTGVATPLGTAPTGSVPGSPEVPVAVMPTLITGGRPSVTPASNPSAGSDGKAGCTTAASSSSYGKSSPVTKTAQPEDIATAIVAKPKRYCVEVSIGG
jgi:hypothetical protein